MRIYKTTYKGRDGKKHEAPKWYIEIRYKGDTRRLAGFTDKKMTEALGRNVENLINCRASGLDPDIKLNRWMEDLPESRLKKFISWGLIEGHRTEITKPLTQHISDYIKALEAKGYSKDYIVRSKNRLIKIVGTCRFFHFRDITRSAVEIYSGKLKKEGYSNTSRGHYIDALKTFLNWAELDQRIISNPIAKMEKPARDSEEKGILTPVQFINLIKTTFEKDVLFRGERTGTTTGKERAVLYLLAGLTGLRRKELLNLTWRSIILRKNNECVKIPASLAKNKKEARQPIPQVLVNVLDAVKSQIRPKNNDRIFASLGQWINTAELIRHDLELAGIPLKDRDGNEICFHSLRNSYISFLANSQTPAKIVQKLARHSDPRLTFNTYARALPEAEQKAVTFLPDFGNIYLAPCSAFLGGQNRIKVDCSGQKNNDNESKTAFTASNQIPPRGVEPLDGNSKAPVNKQLTQPAKIHSAPCSADFNRCKPGLQRVIQAWDKLSAYKKSKILKIILCLALVFCIGCQSLKSHPTPGTRQEKKNVIKLEIQKEKPEQIYNLKKWEFLATLIQKHFDTKNMTIEEIAAELAYQEYLLSKEKNNGSAD